MWLFVMFDCLPEIGRGWYVFLIIFLWKEYTQTS